MNKKNMLISGMNNWRRNHQSQVPLEEELRGQTCGLLRGVDSSVGWMFEMMTSSCNWLWEVSPGGNLPKLAPAEGRGHLGNWGTRWRNCPKLAKTLSLIHHNLNLVKVFTAFQKVWTESCENPPLTATTNVTCYYKQSVKIIFKVQKHHRVHLSWKAFKEQK